MSAPRDWIEFITLQGSNLQGLQIEHAGATVMTLIRDYLLDDGDLMLSYGPRRVELLRGLGQRFLHCARVPLIGILHGDADDRAGVQIDGVLGLVSQMRPAILHLGNLRVGIVGMGHTCVVSMNKVGYCWGGNWHGQLGVGDRRVAGDLATTTNLGYLS
jgi:hypothetical protein